MQWANLGAWTAALVLGDFAYYWMHRTSHEVNLLWAGHVVHHGGNPQYQDTNYAGIFIVWDRLFGTFTPEREPVVFGLTRPLASWNPLWANVHVFRDILVGA